MKNNDSKRLQEVGNIQPVGDRNAEYAKDSEEKGSGFQYEDRSEMPLYIPPQRIVHFDLKGAPPTVDYIVKVLTISKELGATGVLLEWEDMFPWSGRFVTFPITSSN